MSLITDLTVVSSAKEILRAIFMANVQMWVRVCAMKTTMDPIVINIASMAMKQKSINRIASLELVTRRLDIVCVTPTTSG